MATSDIVKGVGAGLNAVPLVGPIFGAIGGIVGGSLEAEEAAQQKEQAERIRKDALAAEKQALRPEFLQKYRADKAAELSGLPGLDLYKNWLGAQMANNVRNIRETSPSGSRTASAISLLLGRQNDAYNKLGMQNAEYKAGLGKDVRNDLWNLGLQQRSLEDKRDLVKQQGLTAASAMENAATYNRQNAYNKILGSAAQGVSTLAKGFGNQQSDNGWQDFMAQYYLGNNTGEATPTPYDSYPTAPTMDMGQQINLPMGNEANNIWNYQANETPSYSMPLNF